MAESFRSIERSMDKQRISWHSRFGEPADPSHTVSASSSSGPEYSTMQHDIDRAYILDRTIGDPHAFLEAQMALMPQVHEVKPADNTGMVLPADRPQA